MERGNSKKSIDTISMLYNNYGWIYFMRTNVSEAQFNAMPEARERVKFLK